MAVLNASAPPAHRPHPGVLVTAYLRAAIACRVLAPLTAAGSVWLALTDHPWLSVLVGWLAFLALFLGGRLHLAHNRTVTHPTTTPRPKKAPTS